MGLRESLNTFRKSMGNATDSNTWKYEKQKQYKKQFYFARTFDNKLMRYNLQSDGKVALIFGKKGSGKTTVGEVFQAGYFKNGFKIIRFDIEGEAYSNKTPNIKFRERLLKFGWQPIGLPIKIYAPASKQNNVTEKKSKEVDVWFRISSDLSLEDWNIFLALTPEMQRMFKAAYNTLPEGERNYHNIYDALSEFKGNIRNFILTRMNFVEDLITDGDDAIDFEEIGNKKDEITVFDLSMIEGEETLMRGLVAFISKKFFKLRENGLIPPYLQMLDEVHRFITSSRNKIVMDTCTKNMLIVTKQGRKRDVHSLFLTQKVSDIHESIFSESDCYIILRIAHGGDRRFVADGLGLNLREEHHLRIATFNVGEALVYLNGNANFVRLSPSPCLHKGG